MQTCKGIFYFHFSRLSTLKASENSFQQRLEVRWNVRNDKHSKLWNSRSERHRRSVPLVAIKLYNSSPYCRRNIENIDINITCASALDIMCNISFSLSTSLAVRLFSKISSFYYFSLSMYIIFSNLVFIVVY